jgi:CspA family cold shock protein
MIGKIKSLNAGYGFIKSDTGQEVFFHKSSLEDCVFEWLRVGQRVRFNMEDSPKGVRAACVVAVD